MGSVGHRHRSGSLNADGRKIKKKRESEEHEACSFEGSVVVAGTEEGSGSLELDDARMERYCRKIVAGVEQLEAWMQAFCDEEGKERERRGVALKKRFLCGSRDDVKDRIAYLNRTQEGSSKITKSEKKSMLDEVLMKTYRKAMSEDASAKDVGAFLDVIARHDMTNGDMKQKKVEIVFPQLDAIFGDAALSAVERRLGIKKAEGEVVEAETKRLKG